MSLIVEKVIIFCPPHLSTKYGPAIPELFAGSNLHLKVPHSQYAEIIEGEECKFYDFFKGVGVTVTRRRVGCNITVKDQRHELRLCLEELAALSLSSNFKQYALITMHDYTGVDWANYAQGYVVRKGKLGGFEGLDGDGASRKGYTRCDRTDVPDSPRRLFSGGFRFRFTEYELSRNKLF